MMPTALARPIEEDEEWQTLSAELKRENDFTGSPEWSIFTAVRGSIKSVTIDLRAKHYGYLLKFSP